MTAGGEYGEFFVQLSQFGYNETVHQWLPLARGGGIGERLENGRRSCPALGEKRRSKHSLTIFETFRKRSPRSCSRASAVARITSFNRKSWPSIAGHHPAAPELFQCRRTARAALRNPRESFFSERALRAVRRSPARMPRMHRKEYIAKAATRRRSPNRLRWGRQKSKVLTERKDMDNWILRDGYGHIPFHFIIPLSSSSDPAETESSSHFLSLQTQSTLIIFSHRLHLIPCVAPSRRIRSTPAGALPSPLFISRYGCEVTGRCFIFSSTRRTVYDAWPPSQTAKARLPLTFAQLSGTLCYSLTLCSGLFWTVRGLLFLFRNLRPPETNPRRNSITFNRSGSLPLKLRVVELVE